MAKIAVDIALLPSDEMADEVIEANRGLSQAAGGKIVLNKADCLPHISLAMGCIDEENIGEIEKILRDAAKEHFPRELKAVGVYIGTGTAGEKVSAYYIEKTQTLQLLHEQVMNRLSPYFTYEVTADMLLTPPAVEESTLLWIKHFAVQSSFDRFVPHITIGFGSVRALDRRIKFAPSRLALCHLGNHCTCRKILASIEPDN